MVLALQGAYNSGKDTVGNILNECYFFSKYSIAKLGKEIYFGHTNIHLDYIDRKIKEEFRDDFKTFIKNFQNVWGEDFFIKYTTNCMVYDNKKNIVISDLRFKNEYNYLVNWCKNNNQILKIVHVNKNKKFEYDEINEDYMIQNSSDINFLETEIEIMLSHFKII